MWICLVRASVPRPIKLSSRYGAMAINRKAQQRQSRKREEGLDFNRMDGASYTVSAQNIGRQIGQQLSLDFGERAPTYIPRNGRSLAKWAEEELPELTDVKLTFRSRHGT